ncbi:MAG TPA: D-2-hydroxyacid dehydrogenase [Thermoanaerobaculia bacterium]|nr:D-2-hydroxyacid dehydrogenase [Thermoanaerobaculia bacterium]
MARSSLFPKPQSGLALVFALALPASVPAAALAAGEVAVCIAEPYVEELAAAREHDPRLRVEPWRTVDDLYQRAAGCDAVVGLPPRADLDRLLDAAPRLRWIQTSSAGVESLVRFDRLRDSTVVLTNTRIIQGPEIADHAFALLLNLTRDMKFYNEQMAKGFERTTRLPLIELEGKTALVIGLGGIGTQIAQRAAAFGMRVVAIDPKDIPLHRDVEYVGRPDELDALLPQADVVFSSVPLTPESRGMLGAEQLALMKDGVYLINVSRGGIVDTEALTAALASGKVRAAGLDVTEPEPLPADHPLWSMPNVTITPHIATASDQVEERRRELFRDNVERFVAGRPLRNVVDKTKGY